MVVAATLDRRSALASPHVTVLRPLLASGSPVYETGMVVSVAEQSFVDALLADLAAPDWRARLSARLPARFGTDNVAELSQPIHGKFQVVLLEAACDIPGAPRVDPAKIDSMGLVLRRGANNGAAGPPWQGWMNDGRRKVGWQPLPGRSAVEQARDVDPDPDPTRRPMRRSLGLTALDTRLAVNDPPLLAEDVLPLFVAPADLCVAMRRTVLFGLLPLASSEHSESAPPAPDYVNEAQADGGVLLGHLSGYLKARPLTPLPHAGDRLDKTWMDVSPDAADATPEGQMRTFGLFLQQLTAECDAFGSGPAATQLMGLFARIILPTAKDAAGNITGSVTAAEFLPAAAAILAAGDDNTTALHMPMEWPAVDANLGSLLSQAALVCLSARYAQVRPGVGKFDGQSRQYAVRGFIRVREDTNCPPRLVWSNWGAPFRILPWWGGERPPVQVPLPDVSDRAVLKSMKPGIAFQLPPNLADLLRGDPKKLRDGDPGGGSKLGIAWLCSFSLPLITICAFIVLNIFLSLFDLIFRWMMFIKICIPIPKQGGD